MLDSPWHRKVQLILKQLFALSIQPVLENLISQVQGSERNQAIVNSKSPVHYNSLTAKSHMRGAILLRESQARWLLEPQGQSKNRSDKQP